MADHIWFVSFFVCMANAQHFEKNSVNRTICMTNRKGSAYEVCIYSKMRWENNNRGKGNRKTNVWKNRENKKMKKDRIIILEFVIELRMSKYGGKMFNWFKIYKCDVTWLHGVFFLLLPCNANDKKLFTTKT